MTVEKLERVLWRVRSKYKSGVDIPKKVLERAIMFECGTSPATYANNRGALKKLGWIKCVNAATFRLTDKDLTGEL